MTGGRNLLAFVPKALRPQRTDLTGVVLWGAAALTGAIYLVQPFDWIKEQLSAPPSEEKK